MKLTHSLSESQIKAQIKDYLTLRGFYWVANAGSLYQRKGIPDILFGGNGVWGGIEAKSAKGIVSPEQIVEIEKIRAAGGIAFVARSVEEVMNVLEHIECPSVWTDIDRVEGSDGG